MLEIVFPKKYIIITMIKIIMIIINK